MSQENYSKAEIKQIVDELLIVHLSKLKPVEIEFLNNIKNVIDHEMFITFTERDQIVAMYDRMGESGY